MTPHTAASQGPRGPAAAPSSEQALEATDVKSSVRTLLTCSCAGPSHGSTPGMVERLVPLFQEGDVRLVLSGHEHNFQHSVVDGIHYIITGAAGKLRSDPPTEFEAARTRAWASAGHFLLVDVDDARILIHPVGDVAPDGSLLPNRAVEPRSRPGRRPDPRGLRPGSGLGPAEAALALRGDRLRRG